MQTPFHRLCHLTALVALIGSVSCYAQPGRPHDADTHRWSEMAMQACHRGDLSAYKALRERASVEDAVPSCELATGVHHSKDDDAHQ